MRTVSIRRIAATARRIAAAAAALLAVASPLAATADVATGTWTTGQWTAFTKAENNLLCPRYLADKNASNPWQVILCDGNASNPTGAYVGNNAAIAWTFPSKATLTGARLYTSWTDAGRDAIDVKSIDVKYSEDGEWTSLDGSALAQYNPPSSPYKAFAWFAAEDGSPIADGVVAVRFSFGALENNGVGFVEMEAIGTLETADPDPEPDLVWSAGGFDTGAWTPLVAGSNMMSMCNSILRNGSDVTSAYSPTIDKKLQLKDQGSFYVSNRDTMTWTFSEAINLQSFSIFATWDGGRDSVSVLGFATMDEEGAWTEHFGPFDRESWCIVGCSTDADTATAKTGANCATLRRRDGSPIAKGVRAVRVFSYYMDSAGAFWAEVEAEGWIDSSAAIFDANTVTVATDFWDVTWTAQLASLGAGDEATVNLWTSLDNETFTLTDSKTVTETGVAYEFKHTFDAVDQTIWYRFETVNGKDGTEWRTTNDVASVVNHDEATYYWKPSVTSGAWEDAANWTNSKGDSRLTWPTDKYTMADFSQLAEGASVTVSVSAAHSPKTILPKSGASFKFAGTADGAALAPASLDGGLTCSLTLDAVALSTPLDVKFADGVRVVAQNGASLVLYGAVMTGSKCGIELLGGATLKVAGTEPFYISNGSEIYLNGGEVTDAGYFWWSGNSDNRVAYVRFGPKGGVFNAPGSHHMYSEDSLCTFRYELPGGSWTGYDQAPMRPTSVNGDHKFGYTGNYRVELSMAEGAGSPLESLEIPLLEMVNDTVRTNIFTFAAFGKEMAAGVPNAKGDYFYWTYDGGEATEPATAGTNPTGLRFHLQKRRGFVLTVR